MLDLITGCYVSRVVFATVYWEKSFASEVVERLRKDNPKDQFKLTSRG